MTISQFGRTPAVSGDPDAQPSLPTRISFRQPVATSGHIDAAWWPRTTDLAAELPGLMDVLWTAAREIDRITYNLHAWGPAPRRMRIEGRTVRLGGFTTSDPLSVRLSDAWGRERIDVLVLAPDTAPAVAERASSIVIGLGDQLRAGEILARAYSGGTGDAADGS